MQFKHWKLSKDKDIHYFNISEIQYFDSYMCCSKNEYPQQVRHIIIEKQELELRSWRKNRGSADRKIGPAVMADKSASE